MYRAAAGGEYCSWNAEYPGETEIENDLAADTLYVLEDGREIVGAVSIVPENEMDGFPCWKERDRAREFARVVIRQDHRGRGLSRRLVEGAIREMRRMGAMAAHISVVKKNIPAVRLYRSFGFDFCGETEMYGNSYYLCEMLLPAGSGDERGFA